MSRTGYTESAREIYGCLHCEVPCKTKAGEAFCHTSDYLDAQLVGVEVHPGDDELQCYPDLIGRLRSFKFWPSCY